MLRVKKPIIIIAILTILYSIYYWGIPSLIRIDKRIGCFEQQIKEKTGYNVSVTNPKIKMGHTFAVWFMADNVALLNDDDSKALNVNHFAIKVNLLPLIAKKIQIEHLSSDSLEINLVYSKDEHLKLGQYMIDKPTNTKMSLNKAHFRLADYKINLKDLKQNKNIRLRGSYFLLDKFIKDKKLKLSTFTELFTNEKRSEIMTDIDIKLPLNNITKNQFKIDGHITNLDLSDFSDYVTSLPNIDIAKMSGKINMYATTRYKDKHNKNIFSKIILQDFAIINKNKYHSISCPDKLIVENNMDTINNGLNIQNFKINSKGIDVTINGIITKITSKNPNVYMNVVINKSRTESFIPLLPGEENVSPIMSFLALKKNPFYGNVSGNLSLKGELTNPDVTGNLLINEVYVVKPLNAPKATIKIDFNGDSLYMDVEVPAPNNEKVFVKGDTELYGDINSDLMITSTDKVDLKSTQLVLNPLHEILKFDIGPVPIMDIRGIGNIKLHVLGTREKPHCFGYFNFNNTTASFLDINNLVIKNANGTLDFNNFDTHFYTKSANYNLKPIKIDGKCNLKGLLDFDIITKKQNTGDLIKIIKTSPMLKDVEQILYGITNANGKCDLVLKLTGEVKDINNIVFNENIFASGSINLYSVSTVVNKILIPNITGKIVFDITKINFDLVSTLDKSEIKILGYIDNKKAKIKLSSDKFILKDSINLLKLNIPYKNDLNKIHTSFVAKYDGDIDKINISGLSATGKIFPMNGPNLHLNFASFVINNGNLKIPKISGIFNNSPFIINLNINNLSKPQVNATYDIQNFNLKVLNTVSNFIKIKDFKHFTGIVNLKGQIKNNEIYSNINLDNIGVFYVPMQLPIKILNGKLQLKNNMVQVKKTNIIVTSMPVYIDGKITNIASSYPNFNLFVSTHPTQDFIEQVFNNNTIYPIKIKGDIICSSIINGNTNNLRNKTILRFNDNSSIYYMGATIGNAPVMIIADNTIYPKKIKINNLSYNNLNGKNIIKNLLNASGEINTLDNNSFLFNNFRIKTNYPTDAKVFNIIFRRPFVKQGLFTADMSINGKNTAPVLFGKLNITDIDIPLLDATINDVYLDFKKDKIYLNSKGTILTNDLKIFAIVKNKLTPPYVIEEIKLHLPKLNINKITDILKEYDIISSRNNKPSVVIADTIQNKTIEIGSFVIRNSIITADNIQIKNLQATNFVSHLTLNEKMLLEVKDYKFDLANGVINGSVQYNLLNNFLKLFMNVKNTNAQILADNLLGINGQIYGSINGNINLQCNSKNQDACVQTLNGDVEFHVNNGKMPKLGSLEYLLKAGNLVHSGVTGLSIIGIVDLITPYKTGEFEKITGNINITNGIANDIQVYSSGKALNLYMNGSYNLMNQIADMQIFGALTKNFSTLFGKIGNASLNTLFNTIPWINISDAPGIITEDIAKIPNTYNNARTFNAVIYGDINGNDYVKIFRWLK